MFQYMQIWVPLLLLSSPLGGPCAGDSMSRAHQDFIGLSGVTQPNALFPLACELARVTRGVFQLVVLYFLPDGHNRNTATISVP